MADYPVPTEAELRAMLAPLPPRQKSEQEKMNAAIKMEHELILKAPDIAKELLSLALHANSEKVRLEAAKYIMDRIAGRVPLSSSLVDPNQDKQPWEDVLGTVFREPSKYELEGEFREGS